MESLIHRVCALRLTQICYKNATGSTAKIRPPGTLILIRNKKKTCFLVKKKKSELYLRSWQNKPHWV